MANTLIDAAQLDGFPGAPYTEEMVDIAVADVRAQAGWHIAPQVTETLTLDCWGGPLLILPTRRIVSVSAIRDVTTTSTALTGWQRFAGSIFIRGGWPVGTLEVDLVHGYATCPLDLYPIIAARAARVTDPRDMSLSSRTITRGPFTESVSYRDGAAAVAVDPVLARYSLVAGVA